MILSGSLGKLSGSHNVKQQNNHTHGRTFTDNREQQLRQAKFLEQKENCITTEIIAFTALGEYLINRVKVIYNKDIILIDEVM